MKCAEHKAEAIAICAYCGRALCADCAKPSATPRLVCSDVCATALLQNDKVMQLLLQKSAQSAQASAFYCYLCGGLSLAAAVGAHFYLPSPFLIFFTAGCGVVLFFREFGMAGWRENKIRIHKIKNVRRLQSTARRDDSTS